MAMTFQTDELKTNCMLSPNVMRMLTQIREDGSGRGGTQGPRGLARHARHRHITNDYGIAYVWTNQNVHILALGQKHNRNKGRGDSGYDWSLQGDYARYI